MANANGATPIRLVPVWGPKRDGKPFHAVNVLDADGDAIMVSIRLLDLIRKATPEVLQDFAVKAQSAVLWYETHKPVLGADGKVTMVDAAKAPTKGPTQGATF